MAAKISGPDIRLDKEQRKVLAQDFNAFIRDVEDSTSRRMEEIWKKVLENYDGKEPVKQFPWRGASNAFIPMTATHTDALSAQLHTAIVSSNPIFQILSSSGEEVIPGVKSEEFARWWQNISSWIERSEINLTSMTEELVDTFVLYGDAMVYPVWETEEVMDFSIDLDKSGRGSIKKEKRTVHDKPILRVLHPKDVLIPHWEKNVQSARRVGIRFDLDEQEIRTLIKNGTYEKEEGDELLALLGIQKKEKDTGGLRPIRRGTYYSEVDGSFYNPDELQRTLAERGGMSPDFNPHKVQMVRMFCRLDLDGDGIPEDVVFDIAKEKPIIPFAKYNNTLHRQKPLIHFYFNFRPGILWNRGVGEMLINIQKIVNIGIRDLFDNNKVNNTKIFLIRKNSGIEENAKVYPTRKFYVNDVESDFKSVDLGGGRPATNMGDVAFMSQWGERISGVFDQSLGIERRSRTPATTTLALLQAGNKRLDRVMNIASEAMTEVWWQVLQLYFQNADPEKLAIAAAINPEDKPRFLEAMLSVPVDKLREKLLIQPEISTAAFNKNIRRQESLLLLATIQENYDRITRLAQAIGQSLADPAMKQLFTLMAKGFHRAVGQVLDTFEVRDQADYNPDFVSLLEKISSVQIDIDGGIETGGGPERSSPPEAAAGVFTGGNSPGEETAPTGRPAPGLPRIPGGTAGE